MSTDVIDLALKALGLLGATIAWLYQVRAKLQREKIKTDLEILEKSKLLFGELDERTKRVEAKITLIMGYLYRDSQSYGPKRFSWGDLALFVACFMGAGAFFWGGAKSNDNWEFALAGGLAFIGVGALLNAFGKGGSGDGNV